LGNLCGLKMLSLLCRYVYRLRRCRKQSHILLGSFQMLEHAIDHASANLWLLLVFVQESLHFLQIFEVADDVVDMILSLLFGQEFGIT
jgi:hypothetical protein